MTGLLPFMDPDDRPAQAARLGPKLTALAEQGVYFGTSSWKYDGWLGTIYRPERYTTRGKFSQKRFADDCLAEYAETFPTVCGDFAFYQFPSPDYWRRLFEATPRSFLFGFKVPEDITVAHWPGHARYGPRAGTANEHFLDAALFQRLFARPLEPYAERVATLIFEFATFSRSIFPRPADFLGRLDAFLEALPGGFRYAVEIRNSDYLGPEYFRVLSSHDVAHVLNAWTRMPELADQWDLPGVATADFIVVRGLLARGRTYEKAVQQFQPYRNVQEPNPRVREALRRIAADGRTQKKPTFLYLNNRLEGHAPSTIEAVVEGLGL